MITTVSKEYHFSYGHRLIEHPGKCSNYHGHNAKVKVTIEGKVNKVTGMVIDFYDLDTIIKPFIEPLDHVMILQMSDPLINPLLEIKGPQTLHTVGFPPTAENLSKYLADAVRSKLTELHREYLKVHVEFWETPNCSAESVLL